MPCIYQYNDADFNISHTLTSAPNPDDFKLHTHAVAELFYFCRGNGVFHVEGSDYILEPGDLLVLQPAEAHYIELDISQPYERKVLHLNPNVLHYVDPDGLLLQPLLNRKPGKQNLYKSYQFRGSSCEHYFDTMLIQDEQRVTHIFSGVIPLLHELLLIRQKTIEVLVESDADTPVYQIIRYLNMNLDKTITLEDLCRCFYISKSQLCRIFRASTGTTVHQYLLIKRLLKAHQMINAGEHATHIYLRCGFNDYSSFYRAYRKYFSVAPSANQG